MKLIFRCSGCSKIIVEKINSLLYRKTKILKRNAWKESEGKFLCPGCQAKENVQA